MTPDTKEQILDSAEALFAEAGIEAVSLRSITAAANVNLAAVHYHFGSKEALVKAVFARRIDAVNAERIRMLDSYEAEAADGPLPVENVIRAFLTPAVRVAHATERGPIFTRLCASFHSERADYMEHIFNELFAEVIARFSAAFRRAAPNLPEKDLNWRAHFTVGVMAHSLLQGSRIQKITRGLCDPSDIEDTIEQMVAFAAAGMKAPAVSNPEPALSAKEVGA